MDLNPKILDALFMEQKFYQIILESENHGVCFDIVKAKEVHKNVCKDMADLEASILPQLPWMPIPKSRLKQPPKVRFKINGEPSALAFKYFDDLLVLDAGSDTWMVDYPKGTVGLAAADYPLVTHETPTLGNQAFIKQHLQDKYKWKPEIWNYKKDVSGKEVRVGKDLVIR